MSNLPSRVYILDGFVNPLDAKPSFLIPLFHNKSEYYVQEIGDDYSVIKLHKVSYSRSLTTYYKNTHRTRIKEGDPAILAFIFKDGDIEFDTQSSLMGVLSKRLPEISEYPYTYLEVTKLLGDYKERVNAIIRLRNILSHRNSEIANKLAVIEFNEIFHEIGEIPSIYVDVANLKYTDADGYLSYWNLISEIENLADLYGKIYIKIKLVKSLIGISKGFRRVISSFGFKSQKIGQVSCEYPIDVYNINRLKQIQTHIVILEARVLAESEIIISVCDELTIRKKYLKKDTRKLVKSKNNKDYFCKITENSLLQPSLSTDKES
jgi:hypothetical protein